MSNFKDMPAQIDMSMSGATMQTQVELIWQMGLVSLNSNNNELILPVHMESYLPKASIEDLKLKLSRHIRAPTIAFVDHDAQVFRICRVPSLAQAGDSPGSASSPHASSYARSSATPPRDFKSAGVSGTRGGKSAVPRPPNAFILYRKDRHPIIKQSNPSMHNNDISIKLGKEWKAQSEDVQAAYRARAERIKKQHAIDHPGYQYAPRKPGDKKRRMTKKKLARMRDANSSNDIADHVRSDADGDLLSELGSHDDMPELPNGTTMQAAEDYIGTRRSPTTSHVNINQAGNLEVTMPSNNVNLLGEVQAFQNQQSGHVTIPFSTTGNVTHAMVAVPQYVQNDDAFLNSLIDWEGIARDARVIHNSTTEDLAALANLELGNPHLSLSDETIRANFYEELDRTMRYF